MKISPNKATHKIFVVLYFPKYETFSVNYSLKLNSSKNQSIVFSNDPNKKYKDLNIKLNGQIINFFNETNHLGFRITISRSFYKIIDTINGIKVRTSVINSNSRYLDTVVLGSFLGTVE